MALSRDMVIDSIGISELIVRENLAKPTMPTEADVGKYNTLITPAVARYKAKHGRTARMALQQLLEQFAARRGIAQDYEAQGMHHWGRRINEHVWAAITKKDQQGAHRVNKVSSYPQLYILIDSHGIRFGLCYGFYVRDDSAMVTIVKSEHQIQEDIARILSDDPELKLYGQRYGEGVTSHDTEAAVGSPSDVATVWSCETQLIRVYGRGAIPADIESKITETLDRLLEVFKKMSEAEAVETSQETPADSTRNRPYWFVGAHWGDDGDQTRRFIDNGIWENGYRDRYIDDVRSITPGSRIAIKATYTRKKGLPFDNRGNRVAAMAIKATGTVMKNLGDGRQLEVDWEECIPNREWYFFTNLYTIWKVEPDDPYKRALIEFTFDSKPQDYSWFRNDPFWRGRYGDPIETEEDIPPEVQPPYSVDDIRSDGCFVGADELESMLTRLREKKSLILQGPPGTGKTWLAKRLAFALIGNRDETKVKALQFHPNLSYEDFVRGLRPDSDGKFSIVDGPFVEMVNRALEDLSSPYVIVIEEINRGQPAQIFGEMLTLLEADRRTPAEALELCHRRWEDECVFIPANLYVIGTMNVADRSLAVVDFAFRRRFAFVTLKPRLGEEWLEWVAHNSGIDREMLIQIEKRITTLNAEITADANLGRQFCIGHSFVTPAKDGNISDAREWFRQVVDTEIGPLLDEYWFDSPDRARSARERLVEGL